MKKYLKYKDFIPIDFINKKQIEERRGNKIGVFLLVILNFFLLPINIDNIFYNEEEVDLNPYLESMSYNYSDIHKWLTLSDISAKSIKVDGEVAELVLTDSSILENIEEKGFSVKKVRIEDDNIIVNLEGNKLYDEK